MVDHTFFIQYVISLVRSNSCAMLKSLSIISDGYFVSGRQDMKGRSRSRRNGTKSEN
jgi:hypothetical protein